MTDAARWRERAERLGVVTSYDDVDGALQVASPAALRAVCERLLDGGEPERDAAIDDVVLVRGGRVRSGLRHDRLPDRAVVELDDGALLTTTDLDTDLARLPIGIHRLTWSESGSERCSTVLAAPRRFPSWPAPAERRCQALFAPAYALWERADPRPSYDGLSRLGAVGATLGSDTVATLPLYAPGPPGRFDSSPYSPISRFHWNELLIPNRMLRGDTAERRLVGRARPDRVDWNELQESRLTDLDRFVETMTAAERAAADTFLDVRPDVRSYASFVGGPHPSGVRRYEVGQWLAELALAEVVADLAANGQRLGLDLPVGARSDSWERATWPAMFVPEVCIGAPPDTFFSDGQNWGLPALDPIESRRSGYRMWHDLLDTACRYADVLRIDHIMQVHRLWWIPEGHAADDGVYVRYPADELLAVAAIVAERTGTLMVGEDLGTVPDEVSELLADWGLVGMYEEVFSLHAALGTTAQRRDGTDGTDGGPGADGTGHRTVVPAVRAATWAGIRTHDMPALARTVTEVDTSGYRTVVGREIGREITDDVADIATAMVDRLRIGGVHAVVIDLDDALGDTVAHNEPGTVGRHNWTHRTARPLDELADEPLLRALLDDRTIPGSDHPVGAATTRGGQP